MSTPTDRVIGIGTRGSTLALAQTSTIIGRLLATGATVEPVAVTTPGDRSAAPVERIGVGVFTQELREALHNGRCDIAVHSLKDLPTAPDPRFKLVVPPREDPREALITRDNLTLAELPAGAVIGTSAPRRISQLAKLRGDLTVVPLRGNIDTRSKKVTDGELDAVVLAYAGLKRIGRRDAPSEIFDPAVFMPAPAQGALAVECRRDDAEACALLDGMACALSTAQAIAERAVLSTLEAGCTAPVAATSTIDADHGGLSVTAGVFALDGHASVVFTAGGSIDSPAEVGQNAARGALDSGAAALL